ncbi:MAG: DUF2155 domain-containing protein [Pseudobdellovibrionaceae bacterium]
MLALRIGLVTLMLTAAFVLPALAQYLSADPASEMSSERLSVDVASEPAPAPMPDMKDKPPTTWYDYPEIELRALDKVTAKATTFKMKVGETVRFNEIYIKVQTCRKPPAIEKVESAAFLQVWEQPAGAEESQWVFSGWMFASSPALSAMDHPIYDVWVLRCIGPDPEPAPLEDEDEGMSVDAPSATPAATEDKKADEKSDANLQDETNQLLDTLTGETQPDEVPED